MDMDISNFLNMNLQKGDGLSLKFENGEIIKGYYMDEFNQHEMSFSFFNPSIEEVQTIKIQQLQNLDVISKKASPLPASPNSGV